MLKRNRKDEKIPPLIIQIASTSRSCHRTEQRRIRLDIAAEHLGVQRVRLIQFECKAVSREAPALAPLNPFAQDTTKLFATQGIQETGRKAHWPAFNRVDRRMQAAGCKDIYVQTEAHCETANLQAGV